MNPTRPEPPSDLGPDGAAFWKQTVGEYALEAHHLILLHQAGVQLDRLADARGLIAEQGLFIQLRGGRVVEHPAAGTERAAARTFRALVRELGLDVEPQDEGYARAPRLAKYGPGKK